MIGGRSSGVPIVAVPAEPGQFEQCESILLPPESAELDTVSPGGSLEDTVQPCKK